MKIQQVTILLVTALVLAGCSERTPDRVEAREESAVPVSAVRVQRQDLSRSAELAAEFRPFQEVDVHAKVAGYLKKIYVDVGDRVSQGQLLGLLEIPEYGEELAQASASEKRSELDVIRGSSEVTRAQAALDIQKLSYERLLAVSKTRPNLIAQQEIDNAAARFREAEAQLATARLHSRDGAAGEGQQPPASAREHDDELSANHRSVQRGRHEAIRRHRRHDSGGNRLTNAGDADRSDLADRYAAADISRARIAVSRIRVGSPVEVRVDSLQRVFQGKVTRFSGRLDSTTRTMETEVDVPNRGGIILPGMYGYARWCWTNPPTRSRFRCRRFRDTTRSPRFWW